jgi:hypothetical protein
MIGTAAVLNGTPSRSDLINCWIADRRRVVLIQNVDSIRVFGYFNSHSRPIRKPDLGDRDAARFHSRSEKEHRLWQVGGVVSFSPARLGFVVDRDGSGDT